MNTNSLRHVNEAKLHVVANFVRDVIEHICVCTGPLALTGLVGQQIKHPHLAVVVSHELSRKIKSPHQLEEAMVCVGQISTQQLAQGLATYCKPITLYHIPQHSQLLAQKLKLPSPEQQAPPREAPQGLKGIAPRIPNPLAPMCTSSTYVALFGIQSYGCAFNSVCITC